MRATQSGMILGQSKTPPAGNRGLTSTTMKESMMATSQHTRIHLPLDKSERPHCGARGQRFTCNRRPGHSGRHAFYHRHVTGLVRAVWA